MTVKTNQEKAFPDYVLDFRPPVRWEDESWHNNACPSWIYYEGDKAYRLWADYLDEDLRESPMGRRFVICEYDREGDEWLRDIYATEFSYEARRACYLLRKGRLPL